MANYNFRTGPSKTLGIAAGIAQGVQNGVNSYNNAKANQMKMAMMQEQIKSQAAYREAQAAALREKTMGVDVDFGQVYLFKQMADGKLLPDDVAKQIMKQSAQGLSEKLAANPQLLPYAAQRVSQISKVTNGGGMQAPVGAEMPQSHQVMADPSVGQPADAAPSADPGNPYSGIKMHLNAGTAKFIQGMYSNMTSQNIASGKNQTAVDVASMNNQSKESVEAMKRDLEFKLSQVNDSLKRWQTSQNNQTKLKTTQMQANAATQNTKTRADATLGAASIRANAPGRAQQDPVVKAKLKTLTDEAQGINNMLRDMESPKGPFAIMTPDQKAQLKTQWNQRRIQINQEIGALGAPQAPTQQAQPATPSQPKASATQRPVIPYDQNAAKAAPIGSIMQTPRGWVEKGPGESWIPTEAPAQGAQ